MSNGNNNLSKEVWEAKDRMSMYQSALKAASTNNQGLGKDAECIGVEADYYYCLLIEAKNGDQKKPCEGGDGNCNTCDTQENCEPQEKTEPTHPIPDGQEVNILTKVAKEYSRNCPDGKLVDFDLLCKAVYDNYGKYPKNDNSISRIVSAININKLLVEEK